MVQSKWRETGQGAVSQEEMHAFVEGIRRIINFDTDGAKPKIQAKKHDKELALTKISYQIHALFIHTGNMKLNNYAARQLNELLSSTNDDVDTLIIFDEILYQDFYAYLAQGQGSDDITLDDVILTNWGKIDSPFTAYYGSISVAAIGG